MGFLFYFAKPRFAFYDYITCSPSEYVYHRLRVCTLYARMAKIDFKLEYTLGGVMHMFGSI